MTAAEWSLGAAGPLLMAEERAEVNWRALAACQGADQDIFFSEDGQQDEAKAICAGCPVLARCAEFAAAVESGMGHAQRHGVYAGMSARERWRRDPLTAGELTVIDISPASAPGDPKRCSRCREVQDPSAFHRNADAADGLAAWCKGCKSGTRPKYGQVPYVPAGEKRRREAQRRNAA